MGLIPTLVAFAAGTLIKAADYNTNFNAITTAFNNTAVLTDVAKTISVAHTFAADILFTDALYDIGKSGATRPRDGFFSRNLTVGANLIAAGGAAASLSDPAIRVSNNRVITFLDAAAGSTNAGYIFLDGSNILHFGNTSAARLSITSGGVLLVGHTVSTAATAGEIVLTNAKYFRGVKADATTTFRFAGVDASDRMLLNPDGLNLVVGTTTAGATLFGHTVTTGAGAGELVLANAKSLRGVTAAGTGTVNLIQFNANNEVVVGTSANVITLGVPATTISAAAGEVVLANNKAYRGANAAGTSTKGLIYLDGSDRVTIGGDTGINVYIPAANAAVLIGTTVTSNVGVGDVLMANTKSIRGVNGAGTDTIKLIRVDANDIVQVGDAAGAGYQVSVGAKANGNLGAAAAARDGCIVIDSTNNRLVYYSSGLRYFIPIGTSF